MTITLIPATVHQFTYTSVFSRERKIHENKNHENKKLQKKVDLQYFDICSQTCLKQPLKKKTKIGFQDWQSLPRGAFCNTFDMH